MDRRAPLFRRSAISARLTIGESLEAGTGANSGKIITLGKLAGLKVKVSLIGVGDETAATCCGQVFSRGDMGPVSIGGGMIASSGGSYAATIQTGGNLASVTVGLSMRVSSLTSALSASILAAGKIGSIKIGGDIDGTLGTIEIHADQVGNLTEGGSLL